jgi:hypothetical protein
LIRSVCPTWPPVLSFTRRTAVYGPVRTVVWEGRAGNRSPYPDNRFPLSDSWGNCESLTRSGAWEGAQEQRTVSRLSRVAHIRRCLACVRAVNAEPEPCPVTRIGKAAGS